MKKNGFTMLEMIVVLAVLVMVMGVAAPFLSKFFVENYLDVTGLELQQNLRSAQSKAFASEHNSEWGVYIETDNYVLYKGVSYASRDASFDLVTKTEGKVSLSGLDEVNFSKNFGRPNNIGNVNVYDNNGNVLQLNVSEIGRIMIVD